jgi:hypothetical protein
MDKGESNLVAHVVVAPQFCEQHLVISGHPPGDVDRARRDIQVKRHLEAAQACPLRHRLEVVHRLNRLHFGYGKHLAPFVAGIQNRVRVNGAQASAYRSVLLEPGVDAHLKPAAVSGGQQPDNAVMLELLAHRPDQNRTH